MARSPAMAAVSSGSDGCSSMKAPPSAASRRARLSGSRRASRLLEPRDEAQRVVALDRLEIVAGEGGGEAADILLGAAIREIGAEDDLRNRHEPSQRADRHRIGDRRGVVVEAPQ